MGNGLGYNPLSKNRALFIEKLEDFKVTYLPTFLNRITSTEDLIDKINEAETSGNLAAQAKIYLQVYQTYMDETKDLELYKTPYELEEVLENSQF